MSAGAPRRHFASDNWAGVHPEVLAALADANAGHDHSYGADACTARAEALLRRHLGGDVVPYLVWNGTAANVLGLASVLRPWEAVICADLAHVQVDECGAIGRFAGTTLLTVPAPHAKLTPALAATRLIRRGDVHHAQARVVSIAQPTEYGAVYRAEEVRALADWAHEHGLLLHMDGARIANAAATLGLPLRAFTFDAGVDLLSFGGTKNGLLGAEAIVYRDPALAEAAAFTRKQGMHLASKGRFVAAQFVALLEGDLWLRSAAHANAMALRLAGHVRGVRGVTITQPVEANVVFALVPPAAVAPLQAHGEFYVWNERTGEVRWMTSWDTTPDDVDAFAAAVASVVPGLA